MNNPLKVGMTFKNAKEAAKFIGYTKSPNNNCIHNALTHYCKFHKDTKYQIIIDEVFDEVIPFKCNEFTYEIGTIITTKYGRYKIIDRYMKQMVEGGKNRSRRIYKCLCLEDGYIFERTKDQIDDGIGCPACSHKAAVFGINTVYDLRPDLLKYFPDPEIAKQYVPSANVYLWFKCPECGQLKYMLLSNLALHGFSCDYCSDGVSYPNKFIRCMLMQLGVDFKPEVQFDWSHGRIYDDYLPSYNMIIENHGKQHYMEEPQWNRDDMMIDIEKKELAINNGISLYIELDCRYSDIDYIKNSVMNSQLPTILNFQEDDIDWLKCGELGSTSLMRLVWDMWNRELSNEEILKATGLSFTTIRSYIRKGFEIGKCTHLYRSRNFKHPNQQGNNNAHLFTTRPIRSMTDNIYFASSTVCEEYYRQFGKEYQRPSISRAAKDNKAYKGKRYKYLTRREFNTIKALSAVDPALVVIGDAFDEHYLEPKEVAA